jgi:hypothetical protein
LRRCFPPWPAAAGPSRICGGPAFASNRLARWRIWG